jgi:hypothetical protein
MFNEAAIENLAGSSKEESKDELNGFSRLTRSGNNVFTVSSCNDSA